MSKDCCLYRHQMFFHTDIHGIDLLWPILNKEIPNLWTGYFDSDFDKDWLV